MKVTRKQTLNLKIKSLNKEIVATYNELQEIDNENKVILTKTELENLRKIYYETLSDFDTEEYSIPVIIKLTQNTTEAFIDETDFPLELCGQFVECSIQSTNKLGRSKKDQNIKFLIEIIQDYINDIDLFDYCDSYNVMNPINLSKMEKEISKIIKKYGDNIKNYEILRQFDDYLSKRN